MTVALHIAGSDGVDLGTIAGIVNEVSPDDPTSIEEMRWAMATYPGGTHFLAEVDGRPVGVATVGRIYMYPPEFDGLWATVSVLAEARRQGVGSALLAAVSERARDAGKTAILVPASDARPEGIDFLAHRDFTEHERAKSLELSLDGLAVPAVELPAGVRLTTLADQPELVAGVHAVASEAFPDIPGGEPMAVGDLVEFRARDVDRPSIPKDGFFVATDASSGAVIGYASLLMVPGKARRMAWHDMTAVARAWRGCGLAAALKRATIGWAIANDLEALQAGNDLDNAAMRAVNGRLGYRPLPDQLTMRGLVSNGTMERP